MIYTLLIIACGIGIGWCIRDMVGAYRREVVTIEQVKEVVQCRSCNKLRREVEAAVLDAERRGSSFPLPMIGNGNKRRVHWEMVGNLAPVVGNKATSAARASPPPY